jgi:hypothetical protein
MDGLDLQRVAQVLALIALGARGGCDRHEKPQPRPPKGPAIAFSACTICHVDLQEQLARGAHGPAGVTCASCHGDSQGHVTDEHNNVKPDRLFTAETAPALCGECHEPEYQAARAHEQPPSCVECHEAHEIAVGEQARRLEAERQRKRPH